MLEIKNQHQLYFQEHIFGIVIDAFSTTTPTNSEAVISRLESILEIDAKYIPIFRIGDLHQHFFNNYQTTFVSIYNSTTNNEWVVQNVLMY